MARLGAESLRRIATSLKKQDAAAKKRTTKRNCKTYDTPQDDFERPEIVRSWISSYTRKNAQ